MPASAPTIVLLPGFDGTGDLFQDFVASLPDDFASHIVRYPTSEDLSYAALLALVRAAVLPSHPIVLVAESFSVPIAIIYAADNPSNLKALILCAGFARSPVCGIQRSILRWIGPVLFRIAPPRLMIRMLLVGRGASDSLLSRVRKAVLSVHRHVLVGRLNSVLDCDVRGDVAKNRVPMLYLRADRDRVIAASCGQEIANLNPLCTIAEINGPHLLLQRNPIESANAILSFIRKLEKQ